MARVVGGDAIDPRSIAKQDRARVVRVYSADAPAIEDVDAAGVEAENVVGITALAERDRRAPVGAGIRIPPDIDLDERKILDGGVLDEDRLSAGLARPQRPKGQCCSPSSKRMHDSSHGNQVFPMPSGFTGGASR